MTNSTSGSDNKILMLLTYIFSPLIPVVLLLLEDKKNDPNLRIHIFQSLILGLLSMVTYPVLGLGFIVFIYSVYIGFQAYNGTNVTIPVITDFCKNQGWA